MRNYEPDIDRIMELYAQLEDDIIASMVKRMLKMGFVSETTRYEAEILQAAGLLREDIMALIAERTGASTEAVKALFVDAGVQTVNIDNEVYREAGEVPTDIRQDEGMRNILEEGYRKTNGTMRNLVSTTAGQSEQAFIQACDRAYMQVASGAFPYQTAVMQAVRCFADIGAMVQYPSGHRDHLDVAVRRAVLTGVGQTSARVAKAHAEKMGCHLMELTAHSGARPEHAAWQGQLVTLNGKDAGKTIDGLRVWTLNEIGYGTGAGFKGWNCHHNWHPYYVGYSTPNYTPEQIAALNERNIEYNGAKYTEYELSQMQRAAERKIRKYKRRVVAEQTLMDNAPDDASRAAAQNRYQREAAKLKAAEKELTDFCKQTGRYKDTFRTQVDGFGRSEAQRAVWANKKRLTNGGGSGKIKSKSELGTLKKIIQKDQRMSKDYYSAVKTKFSHGSDIAKTVFNKFVQGNSVADSAYIGVPHYDPNSKKINMSYEQDLINERGKCVTWFHEHGHYIDDAAGHVSNNPEFSRLLSDDWLAYMKKYGKQNRLNTFDKVQAAISRDLSSMRKHSAVSDIIQGVSKGGTQGIAGHLPGYWTDDSVICSEAFAHMFEAQFDRERYAEMQKYFPTALKKFEEMIGGLAK